MPDFSSVVKNCPLTETFAAVSTTFMTSSPQYLRRARPIMLVVGCLVVPACGDQLRSHRHHFHWVVTHNHATPNCRTTTYGFLTPAHLAKHARPLANVLRVKVWILNQAEQVAERIA